MKKHCCTRYVIEDRWSAFTAAHQNPSDKNVEEFLYLVKPYCDDFMTYEVVEEAVRYSLEHFKKTGILR